jgi:catechol 2,3-dioxygenase-like lactoylglutathione lyase family enzyme
MIGYVTLGTNNLQKATEFYDALLEVIGAKRWMEDERFVAWSVSPGTPGLAVIKPFDGSPASIGNGVMVALAVDSRDKVDALYTRALGLSGEDEGAPGERGPGFYAAYFRDLDGNKLNAFCAG